MGNQHSTSHAGLKPKKNVHWKSAGRPAVPGKPDVIPIPSDEEPNAITLRWRPSVHDGGAPLRGYQVECNRLGSPDWVRTSPPVVLRPELVLSGLEPPHRYQFRIAAINAVGRSEYSELSDVLTVNSDRIQNEPPLFLQHLEDVIALENDKTEFRVSFSGIPIPTIAWFKDDYEIFSSRRTAISSTESTSVLIFHQTLSSDEGEVKCTATNRLGHAVTKARLTLEAAPKLRYPRQYEDGLLYEINETVYLKTSIVGKPTPSIEWRHDGQPIVSDSRIEITNTSKFSMLKIHSAKRSDRGEYQVHARNSIGDDTAAFLVTITAPPDPPQRVTVTRQVDKSVSLDWEAPEDDGGCRIGNYVVEYYRTGWNVWLKATTSRKTNVTLFDLIEGSEYRFRVKAESPYGMSAPSVESAPIKIPGRPVDMEFLAVESKIINEVLMKEDGEEPPVSPAPRRKRGLVRSSSIVKSEAGPPSVSPVPRRRPRGPTRDPSESNEFMLVLYPNTDKSAAKAEKRKSFQLDLEDAISPPPISLSAPELSSRCVMPFKALRNAVSSTELLHEQAMARFYKAVALKEEQSKQKDSKERSQNGRQNTTSRDLNDANNIVYEPPIKQLPEVKLKTPDIYIKTDSIENKHYRYESEDRQDLQENDKWQQMSFDEDYTASTVSTGEEYSDEEAESLNEDVDRQSQYSNDEETYNPRNKVAHQLSVERSVEQIEEDPDMEFIKPLPLPDPNFVPKPILKRRDADILPQVDKSEPEEKNLGKPKKEEKMKLLKKFTKMPVQKPFGLPKILSKKEPKKVKQNSNNIKDVPTTPSKIDKIDDKFDDEGKTVIDYYGNIVKEFGSHRRPHTPLLLNTEELKQEAEKQEINDTKLTDDIKPKQTRLITGETSNENKVNSINAKKKSVSNKTSTKVKKDQKLSHLRPKKKDKLESINNTTPSFTPSENEVHVQCLNNTQVILRKTERATIVIPIDYQRLEQKAKRNVRSAIDYTVDLCLLMLAFWVYFFKDERLAIPFLILIIYRQLQETILHNIPELIRRYSPSWLKKKTS